MADQSKTDGATGCTGGSWVARATQGGHGKPSGESVRSRGRSQVCTDRDAVAGAVPRGPASRRCCGPNCQRSRHGWGRPGSNHPLETHSTTTHSSTSWSKTVTRPSADVRDSKPTGNTPEIPELQIQIRRKTTAPGNSGRGRREMVPIFRPNRHLWPCLFHSSADSDRVTPLCRRFSV